MSFGTGFFGLMTVLLCLWSYSEYSTFKSPASETRQKIIHGRAQSMSNDIQDCIRNNPQDWCNRDLSASDIYAFQVDLDTKYGSPISSSRERGGWGRPLFWAFVTFAIFFIGLKEDLKIKSND